MAALLVAPVLVVQGGRPDRAFLAFFTIGDLTPGLVRHAFSLLVVMLVHLLDQEDIDTSPDNDGIDSPIAEAETHRALATPRPFEWLIVISGHLPHLLDSSCFNVSDPSLELHTDMERNADDLLLYAGAQLNGPDHRAAVYTPKV
jgi:hypothetical protein